MRKQVLGVLGGVMFATALVVAQSATSQTQQTPPPDQTQPQKQTPAEVTLVGCVVQGSTPSVFILENAKVDPKSETEKGVSYVIAIDPSAKDVNLRTNLNHEVRITGIVEQKTPPVVPAGQKPMEKDLLKFTAKTVTEIADRCPPAL